MEINDENIKLEDTMIINGVEYRKVPKRITYTGENTTITAERYLSLYYVDPSKEDKLVFGRMMSNAYKRKYGKLPYVTKPEKNTRSGGKVYVYEIPQDMLLLDATFIRFKKNKVKRNRK